MEFIAMAGGCSLADWVTNGLPRHILIHGFRFSGSHTCGVKISSAILSPCPGHSLPMARPDSSMYLIQLINSLMSFSMQLIYTLLSSLLICTVSIDRSFDLSMIPIFFYIFSNQSNDPFPCEHRSVSLVVRCGKWWPHHMCAWAEKNCC